MFDSWFCYFDSRPGICVAWRRKQALPHSGGTAATGVVKSSRGTTIWGTFGARDVDWDQINMRRLELPAHQLNLPSRDSGCRKGVSELCSRDSWQTTFALECLVTKGRGLKRAFVADGGGTPADLFLASPVGMLKLHR